MARIITAGTAIGLCAVLAYHGYRDAAILIALLTGLMVSASAARAGTFPAPLDKQQLPAVTAYTDATNTFSVLQTMGAGAQFSSYTPDTNGQIGWSGSAFYFREGGTNKGLGGGGGIATETSNPLYATTTNSATPTEMTIDGASSYLPALSDGDSYGYRVYVVARGTAGTNDNKSGYWKLEFVVSNTGGTTTITNYVVTTIAEEVAAWDVTIVADDTNDRPAVKVTGDAASTITWAGAAIGIKVS